MPAARARAHPRRLVHRAHDGGRAHADFRGPRLGAQAHPPRRNPDLPGRRLRRGALHAKLWLGVLAGVFGIVTLFTILFMDVVDDRIAMSAIAVFMNGMLFTTALTGVGGLLLISFLEEQLAKKRSQAELSEDEPGK